jgi:hypothetical protein
MLTTTPDTEQSSDRMTTTAIGLDACKVEASGMRTEPTRPTSKPTSGIAIDKNPQIGFFSISAPYHTSIFHCAKAIFIIQPTSTSFGSTAGKGVEEIRKNSSSLPKLNDCGHETRRLRQRFDAADQWSA